MFLPYSDFIFDSIDDLSVVNIFDKTLLAYDKRMSAIEDKINSVISENHVLQISLENCRLVILKKSQEYDEKISALTGRIEVASRLSKRGGEVSFFSPELNRRIHMLEGKVVDKDKEALQKKIDEQTLEIQRLKNQIKSQEDENAVLETEVLLLTEDNKFLNKNFDESVQKFVDARMLYEKLCDRFVKEIENQCIESNMGSYFTTAPCFINTEGKSWKELYEEAHKKNNQLCELHSNLQKKVSSSTRLLANLNLSFYQSLNGYIYESNKTKVD